jgi:hypothetical protein
MEAPVRSGNFNTSMGITIDATEIDSVGDPSIYTINLLRDTDCGGRHGTHQVPEERRKGLINWESVASDCPVNAVIMVVLALTDTQLLFAQNEHRLLKREKDVAPIRNAMIEKLVCEPVVIHGCVVRL